MPRIASLISRWFTIPTSVPDYWRIPTGVVIMYSAAADPGLSGWTRYSAADGKFIKGTATQGEIGTVTANNNTTWSGSAYSSYTSTDGSHQGPSANYQGFAANPTNIFPQTNVYLYQNTAGGHNHTFTFFPGVGSDLNPPSTDYILLQSTEEKRSLPLGAILSRSTQPTGAVQQVGATSYRYIRGGSTYTNTAGSSRTLNGSSDYYGTHDHGFGLYLARLSGGTTNTALSQTPQSLSPGSHNHTITGSITGLRLTGKILKLWQLASEMIDLEDNIILMYTGNIANLPTYWKVCNGANGTPNMVNYFLGYSNLSTTAHDTTTAYATSVSIGSVSTATWSHGHISATTSSLIGYGTSNLHTTTNVSHSHSLNSNPSGSNVFQPDEIKLCFIQLTKTLY
jgi:hypothetical protein